MNSKSQILAAVVIAALMAGCKPSGSTDENPAGGDTNSPAATNVWQKTQQATTNAWNNLKNGTTNAWSDLKDSMQTTKDYTYDKKDAFVAAASADLDAMDQKIKELADKATNASDSVKADAQVKLQELRDKRAALDPKLTAVKNSTEADWNDVKAGFQNSYDDMKSSLKQAWQWLNEKLNS